MSAAEKRDAEKVIKLMAETESNKASSEFLINYSDIDQFVAAQPAARHQANFLPNRGGQSWADCCLPEDVMARGGQVFTSAVRSRVSKLRSSEAQFVSFLLGTSLIFKTVSPEGEFLNCINKTEKVNTSTIDSGGILRSSVKQTDVTVPDCFAVVRDQNFKNLIVVREWHPYLWEKLTKTYASWLQALPPQRRALYTAPPASISVAQQ